MSFNSNERHRNDEKTLNVLINTTAQVLKLDRSTLSGEVAFDDIDVWDDDLDEIIERCGETLGVDSNPAIEAVYGDVSELRRSLAFQVRCFVPFSARTNALFEQNNVPLHILTLDSVARSIDAGQFVSSGKLDDTLDDTPDKLSALVSIFAFPAIIVAIFTFLAVLPSSCEQACNACAYNRDWDVLTFPAGLAAIALAIRLLVALRALLKLSHERYIYDPANV